MSYETTDHDSSSQGCTAARSARACGEDDLRSHQGSLRSKLVLSLAGIFLVFLTLDELVRQYVIEPEFVALEEAGAIRDSNRVLAAINAEVQHLGELARQWAGRIALGGAKDGIHAEDGFDPRSFPKVDWAATTTPDGVLHWLTDSEAELDHHLQSLVDHCSQSSQRCTSGMTRIGHHALVLFAIVPLDDEPVSADRRCLVVARRMDEALVRSLRQQTQVEFSLQSSRTSDPSQKMVIWAADESMLVVEVQLTGIAGQKLANVHMQIPRDITARSRRTTALARSSFVVGSVAALLMLLLLLQRIVIGPLTAIRQHSDRVAQEGLATEPLVLSSNDEIGQLARAFDRMVSRLSRTQGQLTKASQDAGRSQVASTVIHNVGNVLTNVNSLLEAASERTCGLRIAPLNMLAARLKQSDPDSGLLAATPDYLEGLAGSLRNDQDSISGLLSTLHDNICHIHDVIRAQQQHTERTIKQSLINLKDVIEEAIACCRARLEQESVAVLVSGDRSITVASDRSLILQTMINIIGNALYAMRENHLGDRTLCIDVQTAASAVHVHFRDNGCGISEETLRRIFDAHFTTRESGTGLGLHFCAITLKQLGGAIVASSEGPGRGSTFAIELPIGPPTIIDCNSTQSLPMSTGAGAS